MQMDGGRNGGGIGRRSVAGEWKKEVEEERDLPRYIREAGWSDATLVRVHRSIRSRRNQDIRVGMRFPSGIAAGPVPAEPSAAPSRRLLLTILQIDSNVFKAILRDTRIYVCTRSTLSPYHNSSSRVRRYNRPRCQCLALSRRFDRATIDEACRRRETAAPERERER